MQSRQPSNTFAVEVCWITATASSASPMRLARTDTASGSLRSTRGECGRRFKPGQILTDGLQMMTFPEGKTCSLQAALNAVGVRAACHPERRDSAAARGVGPNGECVLQSSL